MKEKMKSTVKDYVSDQAENISEQAKSVVDQTQKTLRQSGRDWRQYIKDHPFQAMLYGVVVYYSVKGFMQEGS